MSWAVVRVQYSDAKIIRIVLYISIYGDIYISIYGDIYMSIYGDIYMSIYGDIYISM